MIKEVKVELLPCDICGNLQGNHRLNKMTITLKTWTIVISMNRVANQIIKLHFTIW